MLNAKPWAGMFRGHVIPADTGIQLWGTAWMPACAGMTTTQRAPSVDILEYITRSSGCSYLDGVGPEASAVEAKLHRDQHPDGYGLAGAPGRGKTPALYGLCGGLVELWLPRRALYLHGLYPTLVGDPDFEEDRAFYPSASQCFWITGLYLVATEGTDSALTTAATTPTAASVSLAAATATTAAPA